MLKDFELFGLATPLFSELGYCVRKTETVLVKIAFEGKAKNLLENEGLKKSFCYDFIKSIEVERLCNKSIVIAFYELDKIQKLENL